MNLQMLRLTLAITILGLAIIANTGNAQTTRALVPITAHDNGSGVGTDTFGVHTNGTYGKDGALNPDLIEEELPPAPPTGVFDFRFVDHRSPGELGTGQRVHIQQIDKLDTFRVSYQPSDGGFPVTLRWPSGLSANWVSMIIQDGFGGLFVNINMLNDTVATVTNALITTLNIIARSTATVNVEQESDVIPQRFELDQNYPNPFNPTTTIRFAIQKTAFTDIAVYNVIGQKVKTLTAEILNPGIYTATWNGTDDNNKTVTTGVYFVRMVASGANAEFSALRKLLLMK